MKQCAENMLAGVRGLCLACVALLCLISVPASAATFSASASRDTVILGEPVTLTLKLEGASFPNAPRLPPIEGLRFDGGFNQSMNSFTGPDGALLSRPVPEVRELIRATFAAPTLDHFFPVALHRLHPTRTETSPSRG